MGRDCTVSTSVGGIIVRDTKQYYSSRQYAGVLQFLHVHLADKRITDNS